MGEKVKTIILTVLILLSLILTYFLWYGTPPYEEALIGFQESFYFEKPREDTAVITPSKMAIPLDYSREIIVLRREKADYKDLWHAVVSLMEEKNYFKEEQPFSNDLSDEDPLLIVYFNPAFPLEIEQIPYLAGISEIKKMEFYTASDGILILKEEEELHYHLHQGELEEIMDIVDKIKKEDYPLYEVLDIDEAAVFSDADFEVFQDLYLPGQEITLPANLNLQKENISLDNLLRTVFVNHELARKIEEPDGTLIFTDGEIGLRISSYLEYTAPKLEEGQATYSYKNALQKANELICYYGGWPETLYLDQIYLYNTSGIGEGKSYCYARWRYYYDGIPVVGDRGETELEFNDRGLYYYKRSLYVPYSISEEKIEITWDEKVLNKAFEIYSENNDESSIKINDVFLAYHMDELVDQQYVTASPVWVVAVNDENIYLDVSDLNPRR